MRTNLNPRVWFDLDRGKSQTFILLTFKFQKDKKVFDWLGLYKKLKISDRTNPITNIILKNPNLRFPLPLDFSVALARHFLSDSRNHDSILLPFQFLRRRRTAPAAAAAALQVRFRRLEVRFPHLIYIKMIVVNLLLHKFSWSSFFFQFDIQAQRIGITAHFCLVHSFIPFISLWVS